MKLRTLFLGSIVCIVTAAFAAPAVVIHECVPGKPTVASYTWDFRGEANTLFQEIQTDADQALNHAAKLQSFADSQNLSWPTHADQLDSLKQVVNDMGKKLCRLEVIRRVTAPWQQAEIDRIAKTVPLMADNIEDAIVFGNGHQMTLWLPTYQRYADNLYGEAQAMTRSVDNAVAYARAAKEYQNLRQEMGMRSSS